MSLLKLRESIRLSLQNGVKDLREATTHGGRFDEAQLRAWGAQAPCAIVAALGVPAIEKQGGQVTITVTWGVFIVTKDTLSLKRDEAMLVLVPNILTIVEPEQRWGFDGAWAPDDIKAENLYGAKLDAMGVALWAVTWTQKQDITIVNASDLADFLRVRGDFRLSEDPDVPTAGIQIDLPGPNPEP